MAISATISVLVGVISTIVTILAYLWAKRETVSMEFPFAMSITPSFGETNPGEYRSPTFTSDASKIRFNDLRFSVNGGSPDNVYLCAVTNLDDVQRLTDISNRSGDGRNDDIAYFDESYVSGFVYLPHIFLDDMDLHPNATIEEWDRNAEEYEVIVDLNTDMTEDLYCVFVNEGNKKVDIEGFLTAEVTRTPLSQFKSKYLA